MFHKLFLLIGLCALAIAQPAQPQQRPAGQQGGVDLLRPNYVLQPGDQIMIRAFEMAEISERPYVIDDEGFVNLPLLGRVRAGGLSIEKFEASLVELLRQYVRQPQVVVTVTQYSSDPIFFVGAFNAPGIYPLTGKRTLTEMLASIGGLSPNASQRLRIQRRIEQGRIPLPTAEDTPDGKGSVVEISIQSLRQNINPAEDIVLQPFDVITVDRAEQIYMTGGVTRPGPIPLEERESITLLKAIGISGGPLPTAKVKEVRVLRPVIDSNRRAEIRFNLNQISEGRVNDFPLMPNDIVYVPVSKGITWQAWLSLSTVAISILTLLVYSRN